MCLIKSSFTYWYNSLIPLAPALQRMQIASRDNAFDDSEQKKTWSLVHAVVPIGVWQPPAPEQSPYQSCTLKTHCTENIGNYCYLLTKVIHWHGAFGTVQWQYLCSTSYSHHTIFQAWLSSYFEGQRLVSGECFLGVSLCPFPGIKGAGAVRFLRDDPCG